MGPRGLQGEAGDAGTVQRGLQGEPGATGIPGRTGATGQFVSAFTLSSFKLDVKLEKTDARHW